ncbi:MAG: iron-containing redox enzyme family protein [Fibrobacteria bacterium]
MNAAKTLQSEWENCYETFCQGEFFRKLANGSLSLAHYKAFLREEYHNTTVNPKTMAIFFSRLDTQEFKTAAKLLKHTAMEVGHNEMALQDLAALGEDIEAVRRGRALPATEALAAFVIYEMEHRNPLAFLGYLYHLEAFSERMAGAGGDLMTQMGIPESALSFLREHAEADLVHAKWNQEYLQAFIQSEEGLEAVLYGLKGAVLLHGLMFQGIMESVAGTGFFRQREWNSVAPSEPAKG